MKGLELTKRQAVLVLVGLLFAFAIPDLALMTPSLQLTVVHQGLLFGLAAVGLNLLLRHTRLVSFGHAAFFGTGAYTTAVLAAKYDVSSFTVLLVAAVVVATLVAGIIGYLSLRHTGLYFSLLTLAFGQLLYALVQGQSFFGSSDGLPVRPGEARQPLVFGLALDPEAYAVVLYYLTIVILVVSLLVMWRLVKSPFGNALDAIGQDRTRAQFIGIPVRRYVWTAFVISGIYGGVAGALYAMVQQHVRPGPVLYFLRSGDILFMAILGGFQTLLGPLVGGVILVFLQDVGRDVTAYFDALTGFALLVIVFGLPRGLVGSLRSGGLLSGAGRDFREDPTVITVWVSNGLASLIRSVREWISDVRSALGVR
ncbi:branched-chain amino acid ABC transporter permease [Haloferax mediterranei ATCC 33500]|uniref:Branched-chain amino acid ABC transporter permease n=2 Tax=Haloferacaceae TaxID=1644056 RepID=I3R5M1_HALMT|nr:branched-chain amino acid ABC transporter permease protein [Haloferax mediterranei ATCC 33500]AHZ22927.1 branched-chain amino acid ABC transporter permease [Haloferax mediterranei ATCC 33500]ELZ99852.1 branched-chain amino acid ABC transporter permease [Haloferax mediterranei ATCC 33500]QCQ76565.1 branched-chain amino acid ABC transporter permease [Haloferax mediterranei ATCC 33500]